MARRAPILLLVPVLLGSFLAAGESAEKSKPPKEDYYELFKILVDTIDQVERNYVKQLDRRELIEAAIEGVLDKLDPYSAYINPEQIPRFRRIVESEFGGIGIQLAPYRRELTIFSPLVGTPAYRAGLEAGDRIVEIEGESTEGMKLDEAIRRLKGEPGTKVTLTVIHPGKTKKVEVTITRQKIHVDTVFGDHRKKDDSWEFMLEPKQRIGYVRLTAFSRDTPSEMRKVIEELLSDQLDGLILDLRFNHGGLLSSAIEVSDMFVSEGRIVSTEGRNSPERVWDAQKEGAFEGFPMAVLVNRYSASASEIVSACFQDHKRAVIIGERTWGKGSVQNVVELEGGKSLLKLTTASYRRPSGKKIHRFHDAKDQDEWGVVPDEGFELRLGDAEMAGLIHDRRQRDIVRPNHDQQEEPDEPNKEPAENHPGDQEEPKPDEDPSQPAKQTPEGNGHAAEEPEKPPFIDRQLQMAMEYLTGELARAD